MHTIELTKLDRPQQFSDTDDPTEQQQPGSPTTVNVDAIRCFYPRKQGQPGTRITFIDGGGFAVIEDYEDVKGKVAAAQRDAA